VERGDIWHVDLNPTSSREERGPRYVLILSPRDFNKLGTPVVAPITTGGEFARSRGFAVSLSGAGTDTTGVILCHQIRAIDLQARKGRFREKAPDFIIDDVMAKVATIFE